MAETARDYTPKRVEELGLDLGRAGEYGEMLKDMNVLRNAAEAMCRGAEFVKLRGNDFLSSFDEIIFEGAQGLLLDEFNLEYAPHLTSSRTGLYEPARILRSVFGDDMPDTEVVYVTRSYVTRHGAGLLPYENLFDPLEYGITDSTNVPNEWQGSLRFAPHGCTDEFLSAVERDLSACCFNTGKSLFVTHLNETDGRIVTNRGSVPVEVYCRDENICSVFDSFRLSFTPFAKDVYVAVNGLTK